MMKRANKIRAWSLAVIAIAAMSLSQPSSASALPLEEEGCYAGGPGSSECGLTGAGSSCSVKCGEGTYACCQLPMSCACNSAT